MPLLTRLRHLWSNLVHRREADAALDDEIQAYVDGLAAEYARHGLAPDDARRAALIELGGIEQVKDATRDAWLGARVENLLRETRFALRSLARSPVFAATAIITLAIGIAGTTAVFTIVKGTLLRPLPGVSAPESLLSVEVALKSGDLGVMSYPDFRDLRDNVHSLSGLAAYNGTSMAVHDLSGNSRAMVNYVTGEFFSVLGVRPALGRLMNPSDAEPHVVNPIVVVSYKYWKERLHGATDVIGTTMTIDDYPLTIIGVAPKDFIGAMNLYPMDLWIPVTMLEPISHEGDPISARGDGWFRVIGRLAPGRTSGDAQRELSGIMSRLAATYPEDRGRGIRVFDGAGLASYDRDDVARLPRLLAIAAVLFLIIACANVANLALVRAAVRRRELATRLALGASRASLAGRLVIEGLVLAIGAATLGIGLARVLVGTSALVSTVVSMPQPDLSLDRRVLALAVATTLLIAVAVASIPILQITHIPAWAVLKDGTAGAGRRRSRTQRTLVAAQVAASLVLLCASAAVFDTVQRLLSVDPGFDPKGVAVTLLDPHEAHLDSARLGGFYRDVVRKAAEQAGVAGAALTTTPPPQEWSTRAAVFREGKAPTREQLAGHDFDYPIRSYIDYVSPALFDVLRIPLLRGRAFTDRDDARSPRVVIVSQRLASALWPNADPIGKMLVWPKLKGDERPPLRVVGVVADTRHASLADREPPLVMYVPYQQEPLGNMFLLMRSRNRVPPSESTVRQIVASVDPMAAVHSPSPLVDHLMATVEPQRRATQWIGAFGAIALLLAGIGLYGVVAQGVIQRTRELAIRGALGATPRSIGRLIVGEGVMLAAWGVAAGACLSVWAFRLLGTQLEGISAFDPRALLLASLVLGAATVAACWLPARRAARLNLVDALRSDA